jgi:hypothetical protein
MKKLIISTLALALLVGGFALVQHKVEKSVQVADPGTGGGRVL